MKLKHWRNHLAHWIADTALRLIATKDYQRMVGAFIRYGMDAAMRDMKQGAPPPPDWRASDPDGMKA